ncbi:MAG: peptidyl-prolyl cis-trans isomerase, partial [Candidatus Omnitrophota bacterium]
MEDDLKTYYESNKGRYVIPAAVKVSYVGPADKDRIEKISEKIKKGKSLENLAKKDIVKIDEFWISEGAPFPVKEFEGTSFTEFGPL